MGPMAQMSAQMMVISVVTPVRCTRVGLVIVSSHPVRAAFGWLLLMTTSRL